MYNGQENENCAQTLALSQTIPWCRIELIALQPTKSLKFPVFRVLVLCFGRIQCWEGSYKLFQSHYEYMNKHLRSIVCYGLESSRHSLQTKAGLLPGPISNVALKYNLIGTSPYCLWLLSINKAGAWSISQMVACLLSMHRASSSILELHSPSPGCGSAHL